MGARRDAAMNDHERPGVAIEAAYDVGAVVLVGSQDHATRLVELAAIANREHARTEEAIGSALQHAIACGEALIEARANVPGGEWRRWCRLNIGFSFSSVDRCARLATYRDQLSGPNAPTSVQGALRHLVALDAPALRTSKSNSGRRPSFDVEEAKRLHLLGLTNQAIGMLVGAHKETIRRHLAPSAKAVHLAGNARWKKARRDKARVAAAERRAEKVAAAGGRPAKAYASLRQCALLVDAEMVETQDPECRQSLREALSAIHRAEDAIVKALRIERRS